MNIFYEIDVDKATLKATAKSLTTGQYLEQSFSLSHIQKPGDLDTVKSAAIAELNKHEDRLAMFKKLADAESLYNLEFKITNIHRQAVSKTLSYFENNDITLVKGPCEYVHSTLILSISDPDASITTLYTYLSNNLVYNKKHSIHSVCGTPSKEFPGFGEFSVLCYDTDIADQNPPAFDIDAPGN